MVKPKPRRTLVRCAAAEGALPAFTPVHQRPAAGGNWTAGRHAGGNHGRGRRVHHGADDDLPARHAILCRRRDIAVPDHLRLRQRHHHAGGDDANGGRGARIAVGRRKRPRGAGSASAPERGCAATRCGCCWRSWCSRSPAILLGSLSLSPTISTRSSSGGSREGTSSARRWGRRAQAEARGVCADRRAACRRLSGHAAGRIRRPGRGAIEPSGGGDDWLQREQRAAVRHDRRRGRRCRRRAWAGGRGDGPSQRPLHGHLVERGGHGIRRCSGLLDDRLESATGRDIAGSCSVSSDSASNICV